MFNDKLAFLNDRHLIGFQPCISKIASGKLKNGLAFAQTLEEKKFQKYFSSYVFGVFLKYGFFF